MDSVQSHDSKLNRWKYQYLQYDKKNILFHGLFWIIVFITLVITDRNENLLQVTLLKEFINTIFFAGIVYFNWIFLIPIFLNEKKVLLYILFLFLTVLIVSPIKTMAFYLIFPNNPNIQQGFVDNQTFIFLSNLFVAISSTIFQILSAWQKSEGEMQELEFKTTQTELNFLKSQINPHFLFNTLNNLYALTLKKSESAPETVLKLSEIMRYMLYECNEPKVQLSKEIKYLKNYIELERLRLNEKFDIQFNVHGQVSNEKISPLLLTPFIENAFKHGISSNLHKGFIHMDIYVEDDELKLEIENSKGNLAPQLDYNRKSGGIGLANVQRRLEILYPNDHIIQISDEADHYTVLLKLKLDL